MFRRLSIVTFVLCLLTTATSAVERPEPVIILFDDDVGLADLAGVDISTTAGIETIYATETITIRNDPTDGTRRISRQWLRLRVQDEQTNTFIDDFIVFSDTGSYPDPATAVSTTYYCYDGIWEDSYIVNPQIDDFPCEYELGFGIANSNAARYLVTSMATLAAYSNASDGFVDISLAEVQVWNPTTGVRIWRRAWPVQGSVWELDEGLSAVGDFLNSDGVDEVRIVDVRDRGGSIEARYRYYSIVDGSFLKEDLFRVPYF